MKKILTILASLVFCFGANAATFYSYVLTSSNVAAGTFNVTGGTAVVVKGFATGGSNEITISGQTYYKFNSSTTATCVLSTGTFAVGDVITMGCACGTSAKNGKGLNLGSITVTDDFPANTAKEMTYTVTAGDGIAGANSFVISRADSDIKLGYVNIANGTPALSNDATLSALAVNGQTLVPAFSSATETYVCTLPFGTTTVPTVTYTTTDANATAVKTDATGVTGTTTIVVTAEDGTTTKTYTIQFAVAPDPSLPSNDATLSALAVAGNTLVPAFSPLTTNYTVELPYDTTTVPTVTYTTNDTKASAVKTDAASTTGTTTIVVTAEDGTTKTYSITFSVGQPGPPVPPTTLTLHEPGVYEETVIDGGYGYPLVPANGKMYEVYYVIRDNTGSNVTFHNTTADKVDGIGVNRTANGCDAVDGWFTMTCNGKGGNTGGPKQDEFIGSIQEAKFQTGKELKMHIKGFSQIALMIKDNEIKDNRFFTIKVDDVAQTYTPDKNNVHIARFPLTISEHVVSITAGGTSDSRLLAFSLEVGRTPNPRIKWTTGDSIQTVYTGLAIKEVEYFAKYSDDNCQLAWEGTAIPGITLSSTHDNTANGDSLKLSGNTAGVPAGDYTYHINAVRDGEIVSVASGVIHVRNHIWAKSDTVSIGYTGEGIDEIIFGFYADPTQVSCQGTLPNGVTGKVVGTNYVVSGTPTTTGTFTFTVSVVGGETINCTLTIQTGGNFDILYLYKEIYPTNLTVDDGFYLYLQTLGAGYTVAARKAQASGLRADYSKYRMIIIAESADANNAEVIAVAKGQAGKPVLNMKAFSYGPHADRLQWGTPDVGTIATADITVTATHAIFTALGWANGSTHTLFSQIKTRANMVVYDVTNGGTQLATGFTRDRVYTNNGQVATFMQEIPAANHGGQKYILLPMAYFSSPYMTQDAKNLLRRTIDYLLQ